MRGSFFVHSDPWLSGITLKGSATGVINACQLEIDGRCPDDPSRKMHPTTKL